MNVANEAKGIRVWKPHPSSTRCFLRFPQLPFLPAATSRAPLPVTIADRVMQSLGWLHALRGITYP